MESNLVIHFNPGICLLLIFIIFALFLFIIRKEEDQIKQDIEKKGGKLLYKERILIPRMLFISKGTQYYYVEYIDANGEKHTAKCKPSLIGGAYWTDDIIVNNNNSTSNNK
jgi:hypothetical protein